MSYVWEEEWVRPGVAVPVDLRDFEWHLKKVIPNKHRPDGVYKGSVAWVRRIGDRKYRVTINQHGNDDKTFRSLKAAKAYAVAVVTLDQ